MFARSRAIAATFTILFAALGLGTNATATERLPVVATFSILGDLVHVVGQDRVAITTLVGPDGDAHVFHPTPQHADAVGKSRLVFANGLGFEGWMDRLMEAVDFKGTTVTVSDGIKALKAGEDDDHGHEEHDLHKEGHDDHKDHSHGSKDHHEAKDHHESEDDHGDKHDHAGDYHAHDHGEFDPHAWQDIANIKIYVTNIAEALSKADPNSQAMYERNRDAYIVRLDALEKELRQQLAATPGAPHRVAAPHDAFGYFERAYGVEFVALQGLSTESEVSAKDVASLIRDIRAGGVDAIFVENIADTRLIEQVQRETDITIGGTLFSGALSGPDGPAATYLDMMRHNIDTLLAALKKD
jgi:zinc/manganese transport system substrate-binding protein